MTTIFKIEVRDGLYESSFMVDAPNIRKALAKGQAEVKANTLDYSGMKVVGVSVVGDIKGKYGKKRGKSRKK